MWHAKEENVKTAVGYCASFGIHKTSNVREPTSLSSSLETRNYT